MGDIASRRSRPCRSTHHLVLQVIDRHVSAGTLCRQFAMQNRRHAVIGRAGTPH